MGRLGITYEQVAEKAEVILAADENPTIEKVRRALGDTGSNSLIGQYLREWKAERMTSAPLRARREMNLPDSLQQAVTAIWEKVRAESQAENERVQVEAQAAIQAAKQAQAEAEQCAHLLQEHVNKISLELNHRQADIKLLQDELIETRKRCAVAEERAHASEKKEQALREETHQRLAELEQTQQETIKQLEQQFKAREAQYQHENTYYKSAIEEQRQKYVVELDHSKIAKINAEKAQLKAQTELSQQVERYHELAERHKTVEFDLTVVRQHQQEAEKALIAHQTELRLKDTLLADYQQRIEALTEQLGQLKAQKTKKA